MISVKIQKKMTKPEKDGFYWFRENGGQWSILRYWHRPKDSTLDGMVFIHGQGRLITDLKNAEFRGPIPEPDE